MLFFCCCFVLRIEPRASCVLRMCISTELYLWPLRKNFAYLWVEMTISYRTGSFQKFGSSRLVLWILMQKCSVTSKLFKDITRYLYRFKETYRRRTGGRSLAPGLPPHFHRRKLEPRELEKWHLRSHTLAVRNYLSFHVDNSGGFVSC